MANDKLEIEVPEVVVHPNVTITTDAVVVTLEGPLEVIEDTYVQTRALKRHEQEPNGVYAFEGISVIVERK